MRRLTAALVLGLLGCSSAPPHERRAEGAMSTAEPLKFELVQDQDVDIGHGATARLKSVMYAHIDDSRNLAMMQLVLTRGGKSEEVGLERETPGAPRPEPHLGLTVAVDDVDAYHRPGRGWLLVWP